MSLYFFLITESRFHTSYLVSQWIEEFRNHPGFKGILVREQLEEHKRSYQQKKAFHEEHLGQRELSYSSMRALKELYPDLSSSEQAMIELFGVPPYAVSSEPSSEPLGSDLNSQVSKRWLAMQCQEKEPPYFFIHIDQILLSYWIELTRGRIINSHPAVLPYARGMYALETIASMRNQENFRRAAGATVHYIDAGIDTGPIIRAERFVDPFCYGSIWELKAQAIWLSFRLLIQTASMMLTQPETRPAGLPPDPSWRGPNFNARDFTPVVRERAEEGYLAMKNLQVALR